MNDLSWSILLLVAVLLLQQLEEVRTGLRWLTKPVFVGMNLALYTVGGLALVLAMQHQALGFPLAWLFAGLLALNAFSRLGIMIAQKAYYPGGLTAFPLMALTWNLVFNLVR